MMLHYMVLYTFCYMMVLTLCYICYVTYVMLYVTDRGAGDTGITTALQSPGQHRRTHHSGTGPPTNGHASLDIQIQVCHAPLISEMAIYCCEHPIEVCLAYLTTEINASLWRTRVAMLH
jgi:hypothetical protein